MNIDKTLTIIMYVQVVITLLGAVLSFISGNISAGLWATVAFLNAVNLLSETKMHETAPGLSGEVDELTRRIHDLEAKCNAYREALDSPAKAAETETSAGRAKRRSSRKTSVQNGKTDSEA